MRISLRGLVWFGVGVVVHLVSLLIDRPIVVRFTRIPLGFVIMGLGIAIVVWDAWKSRQRKETSKDSQRTKDDGSASD